MMSANWLNHLSRFIAPSICLTLLAACTHIGPRDVSSDASPQLPIWLKSIGSSDSSGSNHVRHEKGEAGFYTARAVAKYRQKDYAGSVDDASRAIALSPQQPIAYTTRATVRLQMGDNTG